MPEIPPELQAVLKNEEIQQTVREQPGSLRFKAMVLGLSVLQYVKDMEKEKPEPDK